MDKTDTEWRIGVPGKMDDRSIISKSPKFRTSSRRPISFLLLKKEFAEYLKIIQLLAFHYENVLHNNDKLKYPLKKQISCIDHI